jgi:hypothetical protein
MSFTRFAPHRLSMPPRKRSALPPETVEALLASLEHPFKREIQAVREVILCADPAVREGVKWNAPSFRTTEWFATVHLRARDGVQVILHLGAKARDRAPRLDDPSGLLEWLGKDRASVKFSDLDDVKAKRERFTALVREWIANV